MADAKKEKGSEKLLLYKVLGGILALFLVGLLFDAVRIYLLQKRVEYSVRSAAMLIAQKTLPWNPRGAVVDGNEILKEHDLVPDMNSIMVSPGADSISVSATGEARAYFAWIFGQTIFTFRGGSTVRVEIPNQRNAGALPVERVAFLVYLPGGKMELEEGTALWPVRSDSGVPDFAAPVYRLAQPPAAGAILKSGDAVAVTPLTDLTSLAGEPKFVGILTNPEGGRAYLAGFAYFRPVRLDEEGRLEGSFARHGLEPKEGDAWGVAGDGSYGLVFSDPPRFVRE